MGKRCSWIKVFKSLEEVKMKNVKFVWNHVLTYLVDLFKRQIQKLVICFVTIEHTDHATRTQLHTFFFLVLITFATYKLWQIITIVENIELRRRGHHISLHLFFKVYY